MTNKKIDESLSSPSLIMDSLSKHFAEQLLTINNTIAPVISQALWQDVANHYSKPVRAYHNLTHLQQLFEHFEQIKSNLRQPSVVALALFYHDIIYDPTKLDNELQSAKYAVAQLQDCLTVEHCERIYKLIMMTATHQIDDKDENTLDSDAAFLLDMDLSILGTDWASYERYAQAVRQEYAHVAANDYRRGRINVLKGLLDHDRLYLTEDYYQRFEHVARQNIEREIELLRES